MNYRISYQEPHKHFINIELTIENIHSSEIFLQMPAWRPGRYELQNYARNIQKLEVLGSEGQKLASRKVNRERWKVETGGNTSIRVCYNCYCFQMDAGGAYLDEHQLYLNFIYCLLYPLGREGEKCTVALEVPDNYKIACGLPSNGKALYARNYYQLADSPVIASPSLQQVTYSVDNIPFHIWMEGEVQPDWNKVISDFERFTRESINLFGGFPEKDYHFLFQMLPYRHYHGVEHSNSTVITLGPGENFNTPAFYENFLGISCHELFHAWNALKIRPAEMMPYDFTKENYFSTGYVIEGVTTYYGDLLLARSGVTTCSQFFAELNSLFHRHFNNFGRYNMSVADSSIDLWIDGYVAGIPNRKVSIYVKGALTALILDLELRKISGNERSMDDAMRLLWKEFGVRNIGYTEEDYIKVVETIAGRSMDDYFSHCIFGPDPLDKRLNNALSHAGCELVVSPSSCNYERLFGFKTELKDSRVIVDLLEPGSPADKVLSKDDEIISVNDVKLNGKLEDHIGDQTSVRVTVKRAGRLVTREITADRHHYLNHYTIKKKENAGDGERNSFKAWLKQDF